VHAGGANAQSVTDSYVFLNYAVIFSSLNGIFLRAYHRPKVGYGTKLMWIVLSDYVRHLNHIRYTVLETDNLCLVHDTT